MNHSRNTQDYFDEFDDIHFSSSLSEKEKDIKKGALKKEFLKDFPIRNSDYYYFLGYIDYMSKVFSSETEYYFKESLKLNPNNRFCQYYYGYFLFDSKKHKEAIKIFMDINLVVFEELGQTWRYFKIKEIIVCCALFLSDYSEQNKIKKIEEFLAEYESYVKIEENNINNPVNYPIDMIKSFSDLLDVFDSKFKPVVVKLTDLMKREKLNTSYSFEYNKFNHFLQTS